MECERLQQREQARTQTRTRERTQNRPHKRAALMDASCQLVWVGTAALTGPADRLHRSTADRRPSECLPRTPARARRGPLGPEGDPPPPAGSPISSAQRGPETGPKAGPVSGRKWPPKKCQFFGAPFRTQKWTQKGPLFGPQKRPPWGPHFGPNPYQKPYQRTGRGSQGGPV